VDPLFIVDGFYAGADGIFVGGCHLGECHYQLGNYDAILTAEFARKILAEIGIDSGRFALEWASAAEGPRYVQLITEFTNKIKSLGPLGGPENVDMDELRIKLMAVRSALEEAKLRTSFGNLTKGFRKDGDYSEQTLQAKINEKLTQVLATEMGKHETLLRIQSEGPISLEDLAQKVGMPASDIEKYVSTFSKKGLVAEAEGRLAAVRTE
jgi:predicted transcriptional regulator